MDTLTHLALGACIGQAVAGKKIGKPALWIGALAQSIPDGDFITALWLQPPASLLAHRGFSHSICFLIIVTPLLAWLIRKANRFTILTFNSWCLFIGFEILVHLFIDAFNAYGIGWLEPFDHMRISFNTIFVADPFFSIWSFIACIALLSIKNLHSQKALFWMRFGLLFTGLYFMYCVLNKWNIEKDIKANFAQQQISVQQHISTPTPFNNWLWYFVVRDKDGFYLGYRSVFDGNRKPRIKFFPANEQLLASLTNREEINQLVRFSQGYYTVENRKDTIIFDDLRFGQIQGWTNLEAPFAFHYYLQPKADNLLVVQRGRFEGWNRKSIRAFIRRIRGD
jgi:inner membrane protein